MQSLKMGVAVTVESSGNKQSSQNQHYPALKLAVNLGLYNNRPPSVSVMHG